MSVEQAMKDLAEALLQDGSTGEAMTFTINGVPGDVIIVTVSRGKQMTIRKGSSPGTLGGITEQRIEFYGAGGGGVCPRCGRLAMDYANVIAGISAAVSACSTAISAWAVIVATRTSKEISKSQTESSERINRSQADQTRQIHDAQAEQASIIHARETALSQRQMFISIWPSIARLHDIDPANAVEPHVVDAVNALELVAVCVEAQAVDFELVYRSFAGGYIGMCDRIRAVPHMSGLRKTGAEMINNNPAIRDFALRLGGEQQRRNAISSLPSK